MRHRKRGRVLGRAPSHRKAMLKNLASALILTERDAEDDDNTPKVKGRVVTTLAKAKEVRPLVERCITLACKSLEHVEAAKEHGTDAARNSDAWKKWRESEKWQSWAKAISPAVAARRRARQLLGDKVAVKVLFAELAPRFRDRKGGYTRVVKLAKPRLGDAGPRAIIEFVGVRDRVVQRSEKPAFSDEGAEPAKA
ncbi:MAG TPA: L17 family ribosomal protein [Pirellulaceae bacterium]|nr:L17 family ribosomal protein [Pirellulaceae bacterium]